MSRLLDSDITYISADHSKDHRHHLQCKALGIHVIRETRVGTLVGFLEYLQGVSSGKMGLPSFVKPAQDLHEQITQCAIYAYTLFGYKYEWNKLSGESQRKYQRRVLAIHLGLPLEAVMDNIGQIVGVTNIGQDVTL